MSPHDNFLNLVRSFGPYLPVLIVMVVGIIIAFARWKRHPKISMLTLFALGGQAFLFLVNMILNLYAGAVLFSNWTSDQISAFFTLRYLISSLIEAGLWVLVLLAIFKERGEQKQISYRA